MPKIIVPTKQSDVLRKGKDSIFIIAYFGLVFEFYLATSIKYQTMKKSLWITICLVILTQTAFSGEIPGQIISSFKDGDASKLSQYFNQTIELTFFEKEEIYSKTQAEIILRDFFTKNPPKQFTILHEGGKESSKYAIGRYTSNSKTYRITFLLKTINSKVFIHQLRIENEYVE